MKEIILGKKARKWNGFKTLVDDDLFDYLNLFNWYVMKDKNTFYAIQSIKTKNGKRTTRLMHQLVYFLKTGFKPKSIDHINGNGLDNRFLNLQEVTTRENNSNCKYHRERSTSSGGVVGVQWSKERNKWRSRIALTENKKCKNFHLGYYKEIIDAHLVYEEALIFINSANPTYEQFYEWREKNTKVKRRK